jgi:hypothetical protein
LGSWSEERVYLPLILVVAVLLLGKSVLKPVQKHPSNSW